MIKLTDVEAADLHVEAHELTARIDILDPSHNLERKERTRLIRRLEDITLKLEAHYALIESGNKVMVEAKTERPRLKLVE